LILQKGHVPGIFCFVLTSLDISLRLGDKDVVMKKNKEHFIRENHIRKKKVKKEKDPSIYKALVHQ